MLLCAPAPCCCIGAQHSKSQAPAAASFGTHARQQADALAPRQHAWHAHITSVSPGQRCHTRAAPAHPSVSNQSWLIHGCNSFILSLVTPLRAPPLGAAASGRRTPACRRTGTPSPAPTAPAGAPAGRHTARSPTAARSLRPLARERCAASPQLARKPPGPADDPGAVRRRPERRGGCAVVPANHLRPSRLLCTPRQLRQRRTRLPAAGTSYWAAEQSQPPAALLSPSASRWTWGRVCQAAASDGRHLEWRRPAAAALGRGRRARRAQHAPRELAGERGPNGRARRGQRQENSQPVVGRVVVQLRAACPERVRPAAGRGDRLRRCRA